MKIVVIGAGIAGLAAAQALKKQNHDVIVYEKNDRIGGRMRTHYSPREKGFVQTHETGAWRVHGPLAEALIHSIGGTLIPLEDRPFQESCADDETIKQLAHEKHHLTSTMKNMSAFDVASLAGVQESEIDKGYHGISDRKMETRAYSVGDVESKKGYFYCAEGWSWVMTKFATGLNIKFGCKFVAFDGKHASFAKRQGNQFKVKVDACILAIPPHAFPKSDLMLDLMSAAVQSHALVHLWFRADREISYIDFRSSANQGTENSPLNQVIANTFQPSDLCQVYSCDRHAFTWLHLYQTSKRDCLRFLNNELQKSGLDIVATEITDINFWEHAVHSWRPVASFSEEAIASARRATQPDPLHRPGLYVCGEAFSTNQGWADGALDSAYFVVDKLSHASSAQQHSYPSSQKEMRYNGYHVDIQKQWLRNHPGGKQALLNHQFDDITKLWNTLHGASIQSKANLWHMLRFPGVSSSHV